MVDLIIKTLIVVTMIWASFNLFAWLVSKF
jgi:hypothetical protein